MLRLLSILSSIALFALLALAIWSWFQPLEFMLYDTYKRAWFPANDPASEIADLNEPLNRGRYPDPAWDLGALPFVIYVRQSEWVCTQVLNDRGEWIENPDYDNFETYKYHLPLGILWQRVWHQGQTSAFVAIPLWLLLVAFSILPAWQMSKFVRRRRSPKGLCPTCAYDLRAHNPGDKCPECGTTIQQKT